MVQVVNKVGAKVSKTSATKSRKVSHRRLRKQELKILYNQLNKAVPSVNDHDHVCGTDVVLKAVQYINQLHRRVANERGVEALKQIQNNARKIALQHYMAMKVDKNAVSIFYSC